MNQYQLAILGLLLAQLSALYALHKTRKDRDQWKAMWTMTAEELLYWKRNAILRDPLTGRYVKKVKRNG
jgi:hypothetical protein